MINAKKKSANVSGYVSGVLRFRAYVLVKRRRNLIKPLRENMSF